MLDNNRRGKALAKRVATYYHAQLEIPDKVSAIKGLVVCKGWDIDMFTV